MSESFDSVDRVNDDEVKSVNAIVDAETENFNVLTVLAGLDPRIDFISSDLSQVDFSDCDLRNHNFSNSDLTECSGFNILIDDTTILHGCRANDSVFQSVISRNKTILRFRLLSEIEGLETASWVYQTYYFLDKKIKSEEDALKLSAIAEYLFLSTSDNAMRTTLLNRIEVLSGPKKTSDFARYVCATDKRSDVIIPTLRYYVRSIGSIEKRRDILFKFVNNYNKDVKDFACLMLIDYCSNIGDILSIKYLLEGEKDRWMRNEYLKKIVSIIGQNYEIVLTHAETGRLIDYDEPLTESVINSLAQARAKESLAAAQAISSELLDKNKSTIYFNRSVIKYINDIHKKVKYLIEIGVPFKIQ